MSEPGEGLNLHIRFASDQQKWITLNNYSTLSELIEDVGENGWLVIETDSQGKFGLNTNNIESVRDASYE